MALESAARMHPAIVVVLAENYAGVDANYAGLVSGKKNWGAFVSENQALVTDRRARLLQVGENLQKNLGNAPAPDAADRERAEAALSTWARQQRLLLADQPVTDCRYVGSTLNCETR
jgi:hypothetical protein